MNNPTPEIQTDGPGLFSPNEVTDSAGTKICKAQAILSLINENTIEADLNAINGSAWAVRDFVAEAETELLKLIEELTARLELSERPILHSQDKPQVLRLVKSALREYEARGVTFPEGKDAEAIALEILSLPPRANTAPARQGENTETSPDVLEDYRRQMAANVTWTIGALEALDDERTAPILDVMHRLQDDVIGIGEVVSARA